MDHNKLALVSDADVESPDAWDWGMESGRDLARAVDTIETLSAVDGLEMPEWLSGHLHEYRGLAVALLARYPHVNAVTALREFEIAQIRLAVSGDRQEHGGIRPQTAQMMLSFRRYYGSYPFEEIVPVDQIHDGDRVRIPDEYLAPQRAAPMGTDEDWGDVKDRTEHAMTPDAFAEFADK